MRFLALEANIRKLKQRFIVEGEEELLATTRHAFAFILPLLWIVPAAGLAIALWVQGMRMGFDFVVITGVLYAALAFLLAMAIHAFIEWRYNFVVVTTEKVVVVDHRFVFSQVIRPIPLDTIATTDTGSQYLGLGNCGYVNLHLSEVLQGTNKEIRLDRLPKPDVIAGIIENARVLKSQRSPGDRGAEEQRGKVEGIQEKTVKHIPTTAGVPPPPDAPLPHDAPAEEDAPMPRVVMTGQGQLAYTADGQAVEVVPASDVLDAPATIVSGGDHTTDAFGATS